jgi:hypothetical protein
MPIDYLVWYYMSPSIAVAIDGTEAARLGFVVGSVPSVSAPTARHSAVSHFPGVLAPMGLVSEWESWGVCGRRCVVAEGDGLLPLCLCAMCVANVNIDPWYHAPRRCIGCTVIAVARELTYFVPAGCYSFYG